MVEPQSPRRRGSKRWAGAVLEREDEDLEFAEWAFKREGGDSLPDPEVTKLERLTYCLVVLQLQRDRVRLPDLEITKVER